MINLQRRLKDLGIGGIIARRYDNNTRKSTLAELKVYAKEGSKHIQDGCSGPGLALGLVTLQLSVRRQVSIKFLV